MSSGVLMFGGGMADGVPDAGSQVTCEYEHEQEWEGEGEERKWSMAYG